MNASLSRENVPFQIVVFCVVTLYAYLRLEDGSSKVLRSIDLLPHHCLVSTLKTTTEIFIAVKTLNLS
jgi:hypothetical protein